MGFEKNSDRPMVKNSNKANFKILAGTFIESGRYKKIPRAERLCPLELVMNSTIC